MLTESCGWGLRHSTDLIVRTLSADWAQTGNAITNTHNMDKALRNTVTRNGFI